MLEPEVEPVVLDGLELGREVAAEEVAEQPALDAVRVLSVERRPVRHASADEPAGAVGDPLHDLGPARVATTGVGANRAAQTAHCRRRSRSRCRTPTVSVTGSVATAPTASRCATGRTAWRRRFAHRATPGPVRRDGRLGTEWEQLLGSGDPEHGISRFVEEGLEARCVLSEDAEGVERAIVAERDGCGTRQVTPSNAVGWPRSTVPRGASG